MKAVYAFDHALTESDVTTPHTLVLEPLTSEEGTGTISLSFSPPPEGLYDNVSVEIGNVTQRTAWNAASPSVNADGISAASIKSGVYSVVISFFRNGALVYATTQDINVFDYMTTSRWVGGGTQNSPINNEEGTFELTQDIINYFRLTNYFVASSTNTPTGNDGNSGSPYAPLATISEAL
nr:hypothetical protein [Treponemataceae bacterium]